MYTWGYIKEATLIKLDLNANQAISQGMLNSFSFYANEAMTRICSSVKPKYTFAEFNVVDKTELVWQLKQKYFGTQDVDLWFLDVLPANEEDLTPVQFNFLNDYRKYHFTNTPYKMPADFVKFGDDISTRTIGGNRHNVNDTHFIKRGYNEVIFKEQGLFEISYDARWVFFLVTMDSTEILDVPSDVLDCLPSYIAHQILKRDDEQKASTYRNEFEVLLASIDNSRHSQNHDFEISGGW